MGRGYWILLWDMFGGGLNLLNPRLFTDVHGNNWFLCNEGTTEADVAHAHGLTNRDHYRVIFT